MSDAEALGGELLLREAVAPLGAGALADTLGRLDELPDPSGPPVPDSTLLPAPLLERTGPFESIVWRTVGAGLRIAPVDLPDEPQRVFLLELPAGFRVPKHRHGGTERVLLLQGGFTDDGATFVRGDVSWRETAHAVRIDADGPCIGLFVNDGPFVIGGALGTRLLDRWLSG